VLGGVLFALGWAELLPNQTTRVAYNKGAIQCEPYTFQERLARAGGREAFLDEWIGWIGRGTRAIVGERFIWLEQKTPFPESYKPFALDLTCNPSYVFGRPVAFLVKQPPGGYSPTYRQVQLRDPGVAEASKATLDIENAGRDEYLVILLTDFATDAPIRPTDLTGREFPAGQIGPDFRLTVRGPLYAFTLPPVGGGRRAVNIQFFRANANVDVSRLPTQILQAIVVEDDPMRVLELNLSVPRPMEMRGPYPCASPYPGCPSYPALMGPGAVGPAAPFTGQAAIVVTLPGDAKLTVDGNPTSSTGRVRRLQTPPLLPGREYRYTLRAEVPRGGKVDVSVRSSSAPARRVR
jgi:uncharacterized protein (TIGR03000 family)